MSIMPTLILCVGVPLVVLTSGYILLAAATFTLAAIAAWRNHAQAMTSLLYVGRVSHTRFLPVTHGFGYPLFLACVDLDEDFQSALWPLSAVMAFRESDHYKNKEGGTEGSLAEKTFQLLRERTKGSFRPSLLTHRVLLVTHLCYFGYCFNPVSFYYVQRRKDCKIDAIVAEVSNTPRNEMQCYVLHPKSVDIKESKEGRSKGDATGINYIFQKTFHVSPFMDMEHIYDWTFWEFDAPNKPIYISTSMIKQGKTYFNAYVDVIPRTMNPFMLAWQLIRFPVYCLLIQLWIHYEAFWLFFKGVAFVPHPKGSETAASLIIGKIMTPLFDFKDWVDEKRKRQ